MARSSNTTYGYGYSALLRHGDNTYSSSSYSDSRQGTFGNGTYNLSSAVYSASGSDTYNDSYAGSETDTGAQTDTSNQTNIYSLSCYLSGQATFTVGETYTLNSTSNQSYTSNWSYTSSDSGADSWTQSRSGSFSGGSWNLSSVTNHAQGNDSFTYDPRSRSDTGSIGTFRQKKPPPHPPTDLAT